MYIYSLSHNEHNHSLNSNNLKHITVKSTYTSLVNQLVVVDTCSGYHPAIDKIVHKTTSIGFHGAIFFFFK